MTFDYTQTLEKLKSRRQEAEELLKKVEVLEIPADLSFTEFFRQTRQGILQNAEFGRLLREDPECKNVSMERLNALMDEYYAPLKPETGYQNCVGNPEYAVKQFGDGMGQLLASIYMSQRSARQYYIDESYLFLEAQLRHFLELYDLALAGNTDLKTWKMRYRVNSLENWELGSIWGRLKGLSPQYLYFKDVVQNADLADLRYLHRYGIHVNEHSLAMAEFMASYPVQELDELAKFIVKSWVDGFVRGQKDYRIKKYANLMFPIGMERLARLMILELDKIGITALVGRPLSKSVNEQFGYDHRFESALILDREFVDMTLEINKKVMAGLGNLISAQAGPVYVELFGETPFTPEAKAEALTLSPQQQMLWREMSATNANLYYKYYRRDQTSFCIIAFPSPEIGPKFPEIFADTLKINLLDSDRYAQIQQKIIDVLDTAEYVHVKGKPGNDTDIRVKMHTITDPANETIFENCVADVNIPVGEVFTSPVLEGTTGTLHVEDIYLGSLRYLNLRVHFEDGWIKDYSCTNFPDPEEGKKYIHENLLLPHDTLPIGEFAIGTNTLAYQVARKHDIQALLPILIIEKMGPHFAIGDTCYSHEEDAPHPNFVNGKEMIAVDNEKSATRKEDPIGAYTQKHMDITLPYDMLASITAITADGQEHYIIRDGRFAVPGTEELNIPLDEI